MYVYVLVIIQALEKGEDVTRFDMQWMFPL